MANDWSLDLIGAKEVKGRLRAMREKADLAARRFVVEGSHIVERRAKMLSSGPARWKKRVLVGEQGRDAAGRFARKRMTNLSRAGGPGVVTGAHRRSIHVEGPTKVLVGSNSGMWEARIGPSMIYSRRLELGFTGVDAIGRRYNQPPYPYMAPAFAEFSAVEAKALWRRAMREAMR